MNDVVVEKGEITRVRCPRTGILKEVDLSLPALSKTMENIRKSAEIINNPSTSFDMTYNRFCYIEELVLDHAQFSPRLKNLQVRIFNKTIEVVNDIEELQNEKAIFVRKHVRAAVEKDLSKLSSNAGEIARHAAYEKAIEYVERMIKNYLKGDEELLDYAEELQFHLEIAD